MSSEEKVINLDSHREPTVVEVVRNNLITMGQELADSADNGLTVAALLVKIGPDGSVLTVQIGIDNLQSVGIAEFVKAIAMKRVMG